MGRVLFLLGALGVAAVVAEALGVSRGPALRSAPDAEADLPADAPRLVGIAPKADLPSAGDTARALAGASAEDDVACLERWVLEAGDPRVRRAALERLVERSGRSARPLLLARVSDEQEHPQVRATCARLLGRAGTLSDVEAIREGPFPESLRAVAAAGLVDLCETTPEAAACVAAVLRGASPRQRDAVVLALARGAHPVARRLAAAGAADPGLAPSARVLLLRGLGACKDDAALSVARAALATGTPLEVRVAAAEALGLVGSAEGRPALEAIEADAPAALHHASQVALQRLARRERERR